MKVVIFGVRELASVAWHFLTHDSEHDVVGFTVDQAFITDKTLHGLPVVPFETVESAFPPATTAMFAPLGGKELNGLRARKFREGKTKGYRFISYVSSKAFTWPDLTIGENCMINDGAYVQPFVRIGDNVMIRSGAYVSHHVEIGDHCFLAARACIGGGCEIGERCFIGLNATLRDHIAVAPRCVIAAGAVVAGDTEENGIYVGVPAKRRPEPADSVNIF